MKIKLKVVKGSGEGREVKIPTPKCLIGRGEGCHMRPKSEAVSRKHCVIYVKNGRAYVRDLKSRNGTYINDDLITEDREISTGDLITVGPITFEVLVDHALGGDKKPKPKSIKEVAARTTSASTDTIALDEGDISDWLAEADLIERDRRLTDPDTRQLKLDETDRVDLQKAIERRAKEKAKELEEKGTETEEAETPEAESDDKGKKKKKEFGKLPERPDSSTKDSREAATEMLKRFFNNR